MLAGPELGEDAAVSERLLGSDSRSGMDTSLIKLSLACATCSLLVKWLHLHQKH